MSKFITFMQNIYGFLWIKKTFGSMKIAEDCIENYRGFCEFHN